MKPNQNIQKYEVTIKAGGVEYACFLFYLISVHTHTLELISGSVCPLALLKMRCQRRSYLAAALTQNVRTPYF